MSLDTQTVNALGTTTRVLEAGPRDTDEAVVLLHGVPGDADAWADLQPRVAAFARTVAFDLPGFGRTDPPPHWDYGSHGYGAFVAAVLDELRIRRVHLVVSDLGGVGLHWAAAHPGQLASVVVMGTGIPMGWRWHAVARLYRTPIVGAAAERAGTIGFGTTMRLYAPKLPTGQIRRWRAGYDRRARRAIRAYYRATPAAASEHLAPVFRRLDPPALVVWGRHDRFIGPEQAARQRESFPSAEVHVLEGSGHYVHLDDPEGVAALVVPFLQRQLGA